MSSPFEAVIGLEIHAQLSTVSKLFCADSAQFGAGDNESICEVCTAMPGALPVLNRRAIEFAVRTGLALGCEIRTRSIFARKQYFYPDLPKGYQISQYDQPICEKGELSFFHKEEIKKVNIVRAHLEEDAGKSIHQGNQSLINLNRAGVPLLEIVSAPDLRSGAEAAEYARAMRTILTYLRVCDGNLEEGSLRCDCNVSVRKKGDQKLGTKVEIKNINSFRFIEKAIDFEVSRQIDCFATGESIRQETRLYDPDKNRTYPMRSKEEAHDYRYFPDPDLLPLEIDQNWIRDLRSTLPELPFIRAQRFVSSFKLSLQDAMFLTSEKDLGDFFEEAAKSSNNPRSACSWVLSELIRELNEAKLSALQSKVKAKDLGRLIVLIDAAKISGKIAKQVFLEMWKSGDDPDQIIEKKGLEQVSDESSIEKMIAEVLAGCPSEVEQFRAGKEKVFGFFVGRVMRASKGQANPELVNLILRRLLTKAK